MANEKRLTAAELKDQQAARERHAEEELARRTKEKEDLQRRQREAEQAAIVKRIEESWYTQVEEAAQNSGVRFCVVAKVVDRLPASLNDVIGEARAIGYAMVQVPLLGSTPDHAVRARDTFPDDPFRNGQIPRQACEVYDARNKGWCPASVPQLGYDGANSWLVVRWDD